MESKMHLEALVSKLDSLPPEGLSELGRRANDVYIETGEKIKKGLEKSTASTGTPIAALNGGAEFLAKLSNVGGGSVKTGGGGVRDGFNTIVNNQMARCVLESENEHQHNALKDHHEDDNV